MHLSQRRWQDRKARWNWDLRWNNEIRVLNRVTSRDLFYDPIEVNGRTVAALIDTWIRYPHPESDKLIPPALQSVAEDLTTPEQEALLIVVAMGLYYDTLRKHLRRHTDVIYDWRRSPPSTGTPRSLLCPSTR